MACGFSDPNRLVYRLRQSNTGFKAGNLRDFCERWGRTTKSWCRSTPIA